MSTPLVSVIIPCFRQGHVLAVAVDSSLAQTQAGVQVVVVNDGSDDDTDAVARQYAGRVAYVSRRNGGLSTARNAGVAAASGKYLFFLDADDAIVPDALARLVAVAEGHADPLVVMGWQPFETNPDQPSGPARLPLEGAALVRSMLSHCHGPPHAFLSTRAAFDRVGGFDSSLSGCADWDYWLRLMLAGQSLLQAPFVGALYRQTPGQMSRQAMHMEEELAGAIGRFAVRVGAHASLVRDGWGMDPTALRSEFRQRAVSEFANVACLRRRRGDHARSARHSLQCVRLGGWRAGSLGLIKTSALALRKACYAGQPAQRTTA